MRMFRTTGSSTIGLVALLLPVVLAGVMLHLFPIRPLPDPAGDYRVGVEYFEIMGITDYEDHAQKASFPSRYMADIWYPASGVVRNTRQPWLKDAEILFEALASFYDVHTALLEHTKFVRSNSYRDAVPQIEDAPYPVILLSPGFPSHVDLYLAYTEYLVSRGYVVVGVEHPVAAVAVVFPDGEVIYHQPDFAFLLTEDEDFDEGIRTAMLHLSDDISRTIDFLEHLNKGTIGSRIQGMLDLSRIGLIGHSGGAGVVVHNATVEPRVRAVFAFDAALFAFSDEDLENGFSIPALLIQTEEWLTHDYFGGYDSVIRNSSVKPFILDIDGAKHRDFAMLDFISPLAPILDFTSGFMRRNGHTFTKDLLLAFFDYVFKEGSEERLFELASSRKDTKMSIAIDIP